MTRKRRELQSAERELKRLFEKNSVSVEFVVTSKELDIDAISERLNLEPTRTTSIGEALYKNHCYDHKADVSIWCLASKEEIIRCNRVEKHFEWLIDKQLYDKRHAIESLRGDGALIRIQVRINAWSRMIEHELSAEILRRLAQLQIDVFYMTHYQNTNLDY